jgi:hypothetical protein
MFTASNTILASLGREFFRSSFGHTRHAVKVVDRLAQPVGATAEHYPQRAQQGCDISLLNAGIRIS